MSTTVRVPIGAVIISTLALAVMLVFFFPNEARLVFDLSALAALAYALVQHHDAHRHTKVLERIVASLSTRYIGDFEAYLACLVDALEDAKSCLICCDMVAYGAFSNPQLGTRYRNTLVSRMNSGLKLRVVCFNADARRQFNKRQFTVELGAWSAGHLRLNQTDAFYNSLRRLLARTNSQDELANLSPDTFLALIESEDADFVKTLTSARCTETDEQIPLNFWIIDGKLAIFAVPSSLHATDEYAFETSDATLVRELERLHQGYYRRANDRARKLTA